MTMVGGGKVGEILSLLHMGHTVHGSILPLLSLANLLLPTFQAITPPMGFPTFLLFIF